MEAELGWTNLLLRKPPTSFALDGVERNLAAANWVVIATSNYNWSNMSVVLDLSSSTDMRIVGTQRGDHSLVCSISLHHIAFR